MSTTQYQNYNFKVCGKGNKDNINPELVCVLVSPFYLTQDNMPILDFMVRSVLSATSVQYFGLILDHSQFWYII